MLGGQQRAYRSGVLGRSNSSRRTATSTVISPSLALRDLPPEIVCDVNRIVCDVNRWSRGLFCLLMLMLGVLSQTAAVSADDHISAEPAREPVIQPVWRSPAVERAVMNVPGSDLSVLTHAAVLEATLPTATCTSRLRTNPWTLELVSGDRLTIEILRWSPTRLEYRWQTGARGTCPRGAIDRLIQLEPAGTMGTSWLPCPLPVGREQLALSSPVSSSPVSAPVSSPLSPQLSSSQLGSSLWMMGRQGQIWPVTSLSWQPLAVQYTVGDERAELPHTALSAVVCELQPETSWQVEGWQVEVQLQPGWLMVAPAVRDENALWNAAHSGEGQLDILRGCLVCNPPAFGGSLATRSPSAGTQPLVWIEHPWLGRLGLPWRWIRRLRLFAPGTMQCFVISPQVTTNVSPTAQPWLQGAPAADSSAPHFEWAGPWLAPRLIPIDGRLHTGEPPAAPLAILTRLTGWSVNGHPFGPGLHPVSRRSVSQRSLSGPESSGLLPNEWPFRAALPAVIIPVEHLQPGRNVLRQTLAQGDLKRPAQTGFIAPSATSTAYRLEQSFTLVGLLQHWFAADGGTTRELPSRHPVILSTKHGQSDGIVLSR